MEIIIPTQSVWRLNEIMFEKLMVPETWEGLNKGSYSYFKFMIMPYKGKTKQTGCCSLIKNLEYLL